MAHNLFIKNSQAGTPIFPQSSTPVRMVNLFKAFISVYGFIKSLDDSGVVIDSGLEKLHYKVTAGTLFLSTALLGMTEMFGNTIQCISNGETDDKLKKAVTQWCFVRGTYTTPSNHTTIGPPTG